MDLKACLGAQHPASTCINHHCICAQDDRQVSLPKLLDLSSYGTAEAVAAASGACYQLCAIVYHHGETLEVLPQQAVMINMALSSAC